MVAAAEPAADAYAYADALGNEGLAVFLALGRTLPPLPVLDLLLTFRMHLGFAWAVAVIRFVAVVLRLVRFVGRIRLARLLRVVGTELDLIARQMRRAV